MRLLLFDIDGTLLRCGPQVRGLFADALEEVFSVRGALDGYDFAGKTDPCIVRDVLVRAGVPEQEVLERLDRLQESYLRRLEQGLDRDRMVLLPGAAELLERLGGRCDVALGLLTGNWEGGARIKLGRFDLNRFFPFGAFGGDGPDRRDLPPVALERAARRLGRRFERRQSVIIGDTLHDVACARHCGLPVMAVATGPSSRQELRQAGADWAVDSLEEAAEVLEEGW